MSSPSRLRSAFKLSLFFVAGGVAALSLVHPGLPHGMDTLVGRHPRSHAAEPAGIREWSEGVKQDIGDLFRRETREGEQVPGAVTGELASPREGPVPVPNRTTDVVADTAERVLPSVVNVASTRKLSLQEGMGSLPFFFGQPQGRGSAELPEQKGMGSGVIVSTDGLVLTNNHVVDDADELKVTLHDGRSFQARVVGTDAHTDLAVLRLEGDLPPLTPLALGSSSSLRLGETVLAVGNPFGLDGSVTMGIVSAKGRSGMGITDYEDFIQTDAAINPGNSGGALVNLKGELVGINTAILSRSGGSQGVGFAIPSDMARQVMTDLVQDGKVNRGYLGVSIQDLDPDVAQTLGIEGRQGALVSEVVPRSPADKAGLQPGDVITGIGEHEVKSASDLRNSVALHSPGSEVEVSWLRDGAPGSATVALGTLEDSRQVARLGTRDGALGGLSLSAVTPSLHQRFDLPQGLDRGVVVVDITQGSPGARSGLKEGDVILEVNRQEVKSPADFKEAYGHARGRLLLLILRDGRQLFLTMPVS